MMAGKTGLRRQTYIDFMKGAAMSAVITEHIIPYGSIMALIRPYSILPVSLFILVMGFNFCGSFSRRDDFYFKHIMSKLWKFIVFCRIATTGLLLYNTRRFDLLPFISNLFYFKGDGAYCFCFLYIQFVLASWILYKIVKFCKSLWADTLILAASFAASAGFIKYAGMLPIHGGVLFGGNLLFPDNFRLCVGRKLLPD